jgi:hypothetical protein
MQGVKEPCNPKTETKQQPTLLPAKPATRLSAEKQSKQATRLQLPSTMYSNNHFCRGLLILASQQTEVRLTIKINMQSLQLPAADLNRARSRSRQTELAARQRAPA